MWLGRYSFEPEGLGRSRVEISVLDLLGSSEDSDVHFHKPVVVAALKHLHLTCLVWDTFSGLRECLLSLHSSR